MLAFYRTVPFKYRESIAASAESIRAYDPRAAYPVLGPILRRGARVLDVGCGAGWFANPVGLHCWL